MSAEITILQNVTASGTTNSSQFRINKPEHVDSDGFKSYISSYGTLAGGTTSFGLEWKAPDGTFYTTGADDATKLSSGIGRYLLPFDEKTIYRVKYIAGNSSGNLSMVVQNAELVA